MKGCSSCAKRRQALQEKLRRKKEAGRTAQAAAIGAVLAVSEAVGKAIGASGEDADGQERGSGDQAGSRDGGEPHRDGAEPDR